MVPEGFLLSGTRCGLKNKRNDLGLIVSQLPARAAGVFTTNAVRAACVDYSRSVVQAGQMRALVVNSGNANCCTGEQGAKDTASMATLAGQALSLDPHQVAVSSTGVIGQTLDMVKVENGIRSAAAILGSDPVPFMDAILTTDLVEKWAFTTISEGLVGQPGDPVNVEGKGKMLGMAKGSGMIAPRMATMLAYVLTDLDCSSIDLQAALEESVKKSFNRMTVDGDTSTNDTLLVMANGASGIIPSESQLQEMLDKVCVSLAKQVARDGEGATKLVEVRVTGTSDPENIARTIAESPLVKTAMFGCDPNWGRILMAAGRSGTPFAVEDVSLKLVVKGEEYLLFSNGCPEKFDAPKISAALKNDLVTIDLNIGETGDSVTIYTCDLGYGYIRINAEYHT